MRAWFLLASIVCCVAASVPVRADVVIVSPNIYENAEGNNGVNIPFSRAPARYQQIHAASEFANLLEPGLVAGIAFRVETNRPAFAATIPSVEVRLSTTDAAPGESLSGVFGDNEGADVTLVYAGALDFASSVTGAGPRPFDLVVPITGEFLYDPSLGNLLLDITILENPDAATVAFLDAGSGVPLGSLHYRVFCTAGCSPSDSAGATGDGLLVTQFTFVPEASSAAAGATAIASLAFASGRRSSRRGPS